MYAPAPTGPSQVIIAFRTAQTQFNRPRLPAYFIYWSVARRGVILMRRLMRL